MHTAHMQVQTEKASRYLKALCNHFNRKVTASYDDQHGSVQFGFANCEMDATEDVLAIHVQADDEENFARVKAVIVSHLEKFTGDENVEMIWVE
jgi:uncharacterized protein